MGVVIDFNKAKAKLKKKAILFKSDKNLAIKKDEEDIWAGTQFEEVKRRGKLIIRLRKEYRN